MPETLAEAILRAAAMLRGRTGLHEVKERGDVPWICAVADFLTSCGEELADVNGRIDACDEPGAVQAALAIARAYLGGA